MWRGSGITTANSPSDSTLQCDTWLWDDMALNSPVAAPCNVARSYGITTLNSPGDSTLQCGRWLWDDMKWNSLKRPPYWNSTSDFEFDHITTVDMSFCTSLRNFIQIGPPSAETINVISIFKMTDLSYLGFYGSNNGFFEKTLYDWVARWLSGRASDLRSSSHGFEQNTKTFHMNWFV